ncbi:MAG TPA: Xaa-Pro peptidase family protein [Candidatus Sulfotelmatobacter sp.]|jgi:Xaa-Pro aminopeptidase
MESCEEKPTSTLTSVPSRVQQVRNFLKLNNLQAWIAWRPDELLMLSGYFPYWGASLLVCLEDAEPILFVPQLEPRDHIPTGLQVQEYPWGDLKSSDPYAELTAAIRKILARENIQREHVSMLPAAARTSLPIQAGEQIPMPEDFAARLSGVASAPNPACQAAFANLYLRKTPHEVDAIQRANRAANVGLQAFDDNLHAGTREADVAAAVESAIYREIGQDGIFHSRAWAMVQSGPNSADAGRYNRSTGRRLENGDLVLIELATCVNGYWSDLTRTAPVGSLKKDVSELFEIVRDAQRLAVNAVKPGVSAAEVDWVARDKIAAHGLGAFFTHHTGHHVGFRYHDPGFLIAPGFPNQLEPGMVITIEPGAYVPERGAGARVEDDVLVTDSGHEVLSSAQGASSA